MLTTIKNKKIFMASEPVDFRMSIDGLSGVIEKNGLTHLHDGSIYVFYNKDKTKIKCLFWDNNGFVLYYKRLDNTKFKFKALTKNLNAITIDELECILSGMSKTAETYKLENKGR